MNTFASCRNIVSTLTLSVILKNRMYSQKYSYTNNSMLWNTIIGLIVMQGPSDLIFEPHREKTGFLPRRKQRRRSASR